MSRIFMIVPVTSLFLLISMYRVFLSGVFQSTSFLFYLFIYALLPFTLHLVSRFLYSLFISALHLFNNGNASYLYADPKVPTDS